MIKKIIQLLLMVIFTVLIIACTGHKQKSSSVSDGKAETEWVSLFNGEDMDGWSVKCTPKDQDKNFWKVENGTILCNSLGSVDHNYMWLISDGEYDNFELRLRFQASLSHLGNSGIQVRSRWDPSAEVEGTGELSGWLDGPQVDIEPNDPWRNGYIYDETREIKRWINPSLPDWEIDSAKYAPEKYIYFPGDKETVWNEVRIICDGLRIKTIINDIIISDFDGSGILDDTAHKEHNVGIKGHIAFQLHKYSENEIRFKDIAIREIK